MAVYVWSDTHLSHKNILKYRPQFDSLKQHEDYILSALSDTINKRDKIYLLGDNAFDVDGFNKLMRAIPLGAIVVYMGGNHDFERNKRYFQDVAMHEQISEFGAGLIKESSYRAWMSHAPIHPVELRNKINIHGHVHGNTLHDYRYINVSVDNVGKPVNLELIREYTKSSPTRPFSYLPLSTL